MLATVAVAAALLIGCGDGDGTSAETARPRPDTATRVDTVRYAERAESICKRSLRETHALGERLTRAVSGSASIQETIVSGIVKPGIRILNDEASRLRQLRPMPASRDLEIYLGLFDPIIELARQLQAVGEAGDTDRAHEIELLLSELRNEQSAAAKRFGFRSCSIGFTKALGGVQ